MPGEPRDLREIEELKYRYLRCLDLKRWDEFADCLVPECTADYAGMRFADRETLVTYLREAMGPELISLHQVHHPEIRVLGEVATGTWYLQDRIIVPAAHFVLEGAAFYEDRYVRTPQGWRITHTGYRRTYEASWSTESLPAFGVNVGTAYRD